MRIDSEARNSYLPRKLHDPLDGTTVDAVVKCILSRVNQSDTGQQLVVRFQHDLKSWIQVLTGQ